MNYRLDRRAAATPSSSALAPGARHRRTRVRVDRIAGGRRHRRDVSATSSSRRSPATTRAEELEAPYVDPDEIAVLLFTSGTTGEPKAAVLRHRHLTSYIIGSVEFMGADEDDAQLVSVPPYHIAGHLGGAQLRSTAGAAIVYLPSVRRRRRGSTTVDERTGHAGDGRADDARPHPRRDRGHTACELPSLRHLSYGGGRMPVELIERAMKLLPGVDFVNAYGLTETSSTIAVLDPRRPSRRDRQRRSERARARLGSVGRPLPDRRGRDPRRRRQRGAGRRARRDLRARRAGRGRVPRPARARRRRLVPHARRRLSRRRRLPVSRRPPRRRDRARRREHRRPARSRTIADGPSCGREAAVVGVPDEEWGEAVAAAVVLVTRRARRPKPSCSTGCESGCARRARRSSSSSAPSCPYNETGKLLRRVLRTELGELTTG